MRKVFEREVVTISQINFEVLRELNIGATRIIVVLERDREGKFQVTIFSEGKNER